MRTVLIGIALFFATVAGTGVASAGRGKQVKYIGIHPVAKAHGGGFCYIEGPHVHVFGADKLQYRDHRGHQHFVGDPVAYGYDGPRHAYKGHHPIQVDVVVGDGHPDTEFCYLNGAHYHNFTPPPGPEFKVSGDVHFYVAEPPRAYIEARPAMIEVNAVYTPLVYARPVVTVDAPVGWIHTRADFAVVTPGVVVVPPRATVVSPGVVIDARIHVPTPTIRVDVGVGLGGGVFVDDGHRHRGHHKHKKFKHKKHKRRW